MNAPAGGARWRAELALAAVTLIWGATFVLVKQALDDVSTLLFLTLRFSLAGLALLAAFRGRYGGGPRLARGLRGGLLAGTLLFAGYVFQTTGLRHTTPSKSAFITGLYVVLVPILATAVYRKAPLLPEAAGVLLAGAGMALMTLEPDTLAIGRGDLLTLGCALAYAGHILALGRFSAGGSFEVLSVTQIGVAALLAGGTFWWAETPYFRLSWTLLAAVAVTGLLATALAFTVQAWAQQHTTATRTALLFALEPVFAWVTSFLVAGEVLSRRAALGAALILGGILLAELKPFARRRHP